MTLFREKILEQVEIGTTASVTRRVVEIKQKHDKQIKSL